MSNPLYIGFSSQKGGVGKSTIAEVLASILYYDYGYRLLVVDCDTAQNSFYRHRERDKQFILSSSSKVVQQLSKVLTERGVPAYPIVTAEIADAVAMANHLCAQNEYELVLFDLAGRCDSSEMLELALSLDYILSPIEPDEQSLASSLAYAATLKTAQKQLDSCRLREVYLLWNKIDRRVRQNIIEKYERIMSDFALPQLQSRLYFTKRYSNELVGAQELSEVFRSTYLPPTQSLQRGTGISELVQEVIEKILPPRRETPNQSDELAKQITQ